MAKRGRKSKPFVTPEDKTIDGLCRLPDGRWRIIGTSIMFREDDWRVAVAKFEQIKAASNKPVTVNGNRFDWIGHTEGYQEQTVNDANEFVATGRPARPMQMDIDERVFVAWARDAVLHRAAWLAKATGIPQLANYANMQLPHPPVSVDRVWRAYETVSECQNKNKYKVVWDEFVKVIGAKTLWDITLPAAKAYRQYVTDKGYAKETIANRYDRIRSIVRIGKKDGLDAQQINAALDALAILTPPKEGAEPEPEPITVEDFAALLDAAEKQEDKKMTAVLLIALNCALHLSEVAAMEWEEINLDAATYRSRREKTRERRAATLWPETIKALRALGVRKSGPVFLSQRGTFYHPNSLRKDFDALRGERKDIYFDQLRDGAYTAGVASGINFTLCELLAGHATGMADRYVARLPQMVKPVCDAIRRQYLEKQPATVLECPIPA